MIGVAWRISSFMQGSDVVSKRFIMFVTHGTGLDRDLASCYPL